MYALSTVEVQEVFSSYQIFPRKQEGTDGGSMDTAWMARGKCRELPPETFFPNDGVGVEIARRICAGCAVKEPCLEYALLNRIEHGVWGGASERERRRIARRRRLARAAKTDTAPTAQTLP
jgi:WhiB family redox-sensing transcriptional regulator